MVFSNTRLVGSSPLMMRQKMQGGMEVVAVDILWSLRSVGRSVSCVAFRGKRQSPRIPAS